MDRPGFDTNAETEIRTLEDEHLRAFLAGDVDTLRTLWSDELLVNSPLNRVHDKELVLGLLGKGVIRHHSCAVHVESVRVHDGLAVVMGRDVIKDTADGPEIERRFTNVWRRADGGWRLFARHAQIVRPQP